MNNNKLKQNKRKSIKLSLKFFVVLALFLSLGGLFVETKTGFFTMVTRKILNSLGIYTEEVKKVEFGSSDFSSDVGGSYHIKKSADWTALSTATIHFEVETIAKSPEIHRDVIFVFDKSASMDGERIAEVRTEARDLVPKILEDDQSQIAFVTFDKDAQIVTGFTNNQNSLLSEINKLDANTVDGTTNYYDALKTAEDILEGYTEKENTYLILLFLTDGLPNVKTPNQVAEYQVLKAKYPYIKVYGIQYEMGDSIMPQIKEISDEQFKSRTGDLHNAMFDAALTPVSYDSFDITDYIDNDYFKVEDETKIETTMGNATLQVEDGKQKVVWHFDEGELKTGNKVEMDIEVKINDELKKIQGYYPTNTKVVVTSVLNGKSDDATYTETPVLQHGYKVTYESNMPSGCSSDFSKEEIHFAFEPVKVEGESLNCNGYLFKGWKVKNAVQLVNDDTFVMPQNDVTVRSLWSGLGIQKSMDGTIKERLTLYKAVAKQGVPDNKQSEFVKGSSGIDFSQNSSDTNGKGVYTIGDTLSEEYPIHYFRGDVHNNNVIFGGFCWQIVRTTETGGVKLIYNGTPLNNQCPEGRTHEERIIGTSVFNHDGYRYGTLAYFGYMYGIDYDYNIKDMDITGLAKGYYRSAVYNMAETNYLYSDTVTYDPATGMYTLDNPEQRFWSDTYKENNHKYTCLSDTVTSCSPMYYIVSVSSRSIMYYTRFSGGETADEIENQKIIFGNDVTYEDGNYKLVNTFNSTIGGWANDYKTIAGANGYHYTCFSDSDTCDKVNYIYFTGASMTSADGFGTAYYIPLGNGKKIDDALKEMTTESDNSISSTVKKEIDKWYEDNLKDTYESMLEDTIWCDDRTISNYGGWVKDGSALGTYLYYSGYTRNYNSTPNLVCSNPNDRFTVSGEIGNGKLQYPVGIITSDETKYAGGTSSSNNTYYLYTNGYYWLMTPYVFERNSTLVFNIYSNGALRNYNVIMSVGIRPSVSLKPGVLYSAGNGTPEEPYIVDLQE